MPSLKYKTLLLPSDYEAIKYVLESESGMTTNHFDQDPWDVFYGTDNLTPSETTQSTETFSTTKHDPPHYQRGTIQVWDFVVDQQLDFLAGNVIKYVCRAGHKNQESELDDWLKVKAYVLRKIKALEDGNS